MMSRLFQITCFAISFHSAEGASAAAWRNGSGGPGKSFADIARGGTAAAPRTAVAIKVSDENKQPDEIETEIKTFDEDPRTRYIVINGANMAFSYWRAKGLEHPQCHQVWEGIQFVVDWYCNQEEKVTGKKSTLIEEKRIFVVVPEYFETDSKYHFRYKCPQGLKKILITQKCDPKVEDHHPASAGHQHDLDDLATIFVAMQLTVPNESVCQYVDSDKYRDWVSKLTEPKNAEKYLAKLDDKFFKPPFQHDKLGKSKFSNAKIAEFLELSDNPRDEKNRLHVTPEFVKDNSSPCGFSFHPGLKTWKAIKKPKVHEEFSTPKDAVRPGIYDRTFVMPEPNFKPTCAKPASSNAPVSLGGSKRNKGRVRKSKSKSKNQTKAQRGEKVEEDEWDIALKEHGSKLHAFTAAENQEYDAPMRSWLHYQRMLQQARKQKIEMDAQLQREVDGLESTKDPSANANLVQQTVDNLQHKMNDFSQRIGNQQKKLNKFAKNLREEKERKELLKKLRKKRRGQASQRKPNSVVPHTPELRFPVGHRVRARIVGNQWVPGMVIRHWERGNPYRIRLDKEVVIGNKSTMEIFVGQEHDVQAEHLRFAVNDLVRVRCQNNFWKPGKIIRQWVDGYAYRIAWDTGGEFNVPAFFADDNNFIQAEPICDTKYNLRFAVGDRVFAGMDSWSGRARNWESGTIEAVWHPQWVQNENENANPDIGNGSKWEVIFNPYLIRLDRTIDVIDCDSPEIWANGDTDYYVRAQSKSPLPERLQKQPLRFKLGDRVDVTAPNSACWESGTISKVWDQQWDAESQGIVWYPYRVRVDAGGFLDRDLWVMDDGNYILPESTLPRELQKNRLRFNIGDFVEVADFDGQHWESGDIVAVWKKRREPASEKTLWWPYLVRLEEGMHVWGHHDTEEFIRRRDEGGGEEGNEKNVKKGKGQRKVRGKGKKKRKKGKRRGR